MNEVDLRALAFGRPAPERVALLSIWFHGHNNPRYAELLPRLERLDACLLRLPDARVRRGIGFRAFVAAKPVLHRAVFAAAARRYRNLLTLDFEQLARWPNAAVMDADDPTFTQREVGLLQRPALRGYVVTAEHAARQVRVARRRQAVGRDPTGRQSRSGDARAAPRGDRAASSRARSCSAGWPHICSRPATATPTTRSTTSTTCSSSGSRSTRGCRTRGSGSSETPSDRSARARGRPRRHRS